MARNWVKHRVSGQRLEVEEDSAGRFVIINGRRQRWAPEDGDWVPDDVETKITAVQIAKLVYAADSVMCEVLGIRPEAPSFLDLRQTERAQWIEGTNQLTGSRAELAAMLRKYLAEMVFDGE